MLVCNVSLRPPRAGIAVDIAEAAEAVDATATGNIVFATLVDDPASVGETVDAYLGEIMLEAASAGDTIDGSVPAVFSADVAEAAAAAATQDATAGLPPALDGITSLTGAWSLSRDMLTSFAGGTRYTKTGSAITALNDQSGAGRNMSTSLSAQRPTEITAFPTSILCADFDGVGNRLQGAAISNFITASSGAMVVSVIIDAITANSGLNYGNNSIMADGSGYIGLFAKTASGGTIYSYNYDGNEDVATAPGTIATPYVLMWRHHGGNVYFSINGGTEVATASGNTSSLSANLYIGTGQATYCDMKLAEAFTTSNGSQTAALATAIANMKTYIGA